MYGLSPEKILTSIGLMEEAGSALLFWSGVIQFGIEARSGIEKRDVELIQKEVIGKFKSIKLRPARQKGASNKSRSLDAIIYDSLFMRNDFTSASAMRQKSPFLKEIPMLLLKSSSIRLSYPGSRS